MEEIVRRLRNRSLNSLKALKESMPPQGLLEADEDEEEKDPLDISDEEEEIDAVEDDSTAPEQGEIDTPAEEEEEPSEEDTVTPDDEDPASAATEEENPNPLDNSYAVNYTIGQEVVLAYSNGTKSKLKGKIEGYDPEGFYRILWGNGMTTNGITDLALLDFIEVNQNENTCVCGSTNFVTEDDQLVCDNCGRQVQESLDQLTLADKSRPKGKKLIRSEAHPVSTAIKPDIVESAGDAESRTVGIYGDEVTGMNSVDEIVAYLEDKGLTVSDVEGDMDYGWEMNVTGSPRDLFFAITNTFNGYRCDSVSEFIDKYAIDESIESEESQDKDMNAIKESIRKAFSKRKTLSESAISDSSVFYKLKELEGEFWTRTSEMIDDIKELGYEVSDSNAEYIIVAATDEDGDYELQVPIGGTSRTMTLDFDRAREL